MALSVRCGYRGPSSPHDLSQASDHAALRMTGFLPGHEWGTLPSVFSYAYIDKTGVPGFCARNARIGGVGRRERWDRNWNSEHLEGRCKPLQPFLSVPDSADVVGDGLRRAEADSYARRVAIPLVL